MKKLFFLSATLFSLHLFAQNVSGIYSGTLVNDSTKKIQNYELALSEYRDKITGYAYTTFVVNDTFYYSIKTIKATKKDGVLVVEDDKMLVNNFPESPAKRVKQSNTIKLPATDSIINLNGTWQTNKTKIYYPLRGALDLKKDNDSSHSALVAHLTELGVVPQHTNATNNATAATKIKVKTDEVKIKTEQPKSKTVLPAAVATSLKPYTQRQQNTVQYFDVASDSLVLSFYDNGVVDGDIISVYVNSDNIISNSKLLASATKKTVYLNKYNTDSVKLVLVAENLGSIPPNTGLLVVQDGDKRYEVRFTADLETNAAIVFKKRK